MTGKYALAAMAAAGLATAQAPTAAAGPDPYIGEVAIYPYTFCPRSWVPANGQLLAINQYQALFSLYGTTFGGDGRTTFALPDLRGRVVVGVGQGQGLTDHRQGARFGAEQTTLSVANLPAHAHGASVMASTAAPDARSPAGNAPADFTSTDVDAYTAGAPDAPMVEGTVSVEETGGGQPFAAHQPSLALQYCVATQGIYPSRN
ncbi:tail fiber protein [Henriciella sp.]|uniref:phage tail protein n=1 Tax=Henriciella sp. TaxID=1968823 RepID=UPI002630B8F9|nr:tail fiber protein [Henriciella sp.]